jgi:hypothetical protein
MTGISKLGLSWADRGISLVQVNKNNILETAYIPFDDFQDSELSQSITADPRLLEVLQQTVRNQGFSTSEVHLSLPSRDVIIRWFLIPWMKPHEVQGVVAFEARKYIPFQLEELIYTYYPSTIVQAGVKQVAVVFVAIRKEVFKRYSNALSQAGLNVVYSEPSSISFLRALFIRKILDVHHVAAILRMDELNSCELDIVSDGVVKFIRDFNLGQNASAADGSDVLRSKLYNEIRLSFDFFHRAHPETEVGRIVAFSSQLNREVFSGIGEDLGIPVLTADVSSILEKTDVTDVGAVGAFGAALSGSVRQVVDLNLSEGDASVVQLKTEEKNTLKVPPFIFSIAAFIFFIIAVGSVWGITTGILSEKRRQVAIVKERLGQFSDLPLEDIQRKQTEQEIVLKAISSLELRTEFTPFVIQLVKSLPEGMWLTSLNVYFNQKTPGTDTPGAPELDSTGSKQAFSGLRLSLSGYVYKGDSTTELEVAYQFAASLKADEKISRYLKEIKVTSTRNEVVDGSPATFFTLTSQ